jgi:hypothetical protein
MVVRRQEDSPTLAFPRSGFHMQSDREWSQSFLFSLNLSSCFQSRTDSSSIVEELNPFPNFCQNFRLVLSSNAHNDCSVYWHETHNYSLQIWERHMQVWDSKFLEFLFRIFGQRFEIVSFPPIYSAEFQQRSSTSMKLISWTIDPMKACEYSLEIEWSLLYRSIQLLPWIQSQQYPFHIFWLLLVVKSDFMLVSRLSFLGLVGRAEHYNFPWCFTSVWLLLFYGCGRPQDLVSWPHRFFHRMTLIHRASAHIDSPSVATSILCGSLSSILGPRVGKNCHPLIRQDHLCQISPLSDQESWTLPYRLASSCNCGFIIVKPTTLPSSITLWSLIV